MGVPGESFWRSHAGSSHPELLQSLLTLCHCCAWLYRPCGARELEAVAPPPSLLRVAPSLSLLWEMSGWSSDAHMDFRTLTDLLTQMTKYEFNSNNHISIVGKMQMTIKAELCVLQYIKNVGISS